MSDQVRLPSDPNRESSRLIFCFQWLDSNLQDDLNLEMWGIWQPSTGSESYMAEPYPWEA